MHRMFVCIRKQWYIINVLMSSIACHESQRTMCRVFPAGAATTPTVSWTRHQRGSTRCHAAGWLSAGPPIPKGSQQALYEGLLGVAAEVFERKSVWSKTQSSLQQLQVEHAAEADTCHDLNANTMTYESGGCIRTNQMYIIVDVHGCRSTRGSRQQCS
jgi:hypothetical protein